MPRSPSCSAPRPALAPASAFQMTGWIYNVIKEVGNIGEVRDRNLVTVTRSTPRGINREWKDGGVFFPRILD